MLTSEKTTTTQPSHRLLSKKMKKSACEEIQNMSKFKAMKKKTRKKYEEENGNMKKFKNMRKNISTGL